MQFTSFDLSGFNMLPWIVLEVDREIISNALQTFVPSPPECLQTTKAPLHSSDVAKSYAHFFQWEIPWDCVLFSSSIVCASSFVRAFSFSSVDRARIASDLK
jgi:hypothetical protein